MEEDQIALIARNGVERNKKKKMQTLLLAKPQDEKRIRPRRTNNMVQNIEILLHKDYKMYIFVKDETNKIKNQL